MSVPAVEEQKGTRYTVLALVPQSPPGSTQEVWTVVGEFRATGKPQARRLAMQQLVAEGYGEATLVAFAGSLERETLAVAATPKLVVKQ